MTNAATAYHEKNVALFTERVALKESLAELENLLQTGDLDTTQRHARNTISHRLDSVTAEIVDLNYGLVRSYVKKFTSNATAYDSEDFEGAGVVGLMRAIDTYDASRGKFGSWAFKRIQREVLRAVRDSDHPNMNPGDFERRPDILKALAQLQDGNEEYMPSSEEIATVAGTTVDQVRRVLQAPHLESINAPVGDEGDATVGDLIEDSALDVADAVLSQMEVDALERFGLTSLDDRELYVISRRFGLDCEPEQRLKAIGDTLGLSREAVRQVESKALAKMKHPVALRRIARQGRF